MANSVGLAFALCRHAREGAPFRSLASSHGAPRIVFFQKVFPPRLVPLNHYRLLKTGITAHHDRPANPLRSLRDKVTHVVGVIGEVKQRSRTFGEAFLAGRAPFGDGTVVRCVWPIRRERREPGVGG